MTSFQSKTGRDRPIKREKKNSQSDQFLLDLEYKFPKKKAKKLTKLKNINTASFQDKTGRDKQRTGEKKNLVPIYPYPTRNREFQKKQQKNSKTSLWLQMKPKRVVTGREREKKNSRSDQFQPDPEWRIPKKKIAKKLKKLKNNIIASFQAKMGREKPRKREK